MKLKHKEPCSECPWRTEAPAGWLGGYAASYYADAVCAGEVPACHKRDHGPESDKTAFCAGALACMANQHKMPTGHHKGQESAGQAVQAAGRRPDVFYHHSEFYHHHTGLEWVHPLMRPKKDQGQ